MEQSFKFRAEEVGSWENLAAYFDEPFMNKVIQRFNEMFLEMKRVKEKESK